MPGLSPQETVDEIHAAINAADTSAVMACFDDGAVFLHPAGNGEARGKEAIADAMAAFLETRPKLEVRLSKCVAIGDLSLVVTEWSLEATGPDGNTVAASGKTADVLRQGADARWRFVIDNPNGVD